MKTRLRVNPLAVFAVAIGLYSVASNWALAGTPLWLGGGAAGAAIALAWWKDASSVGLALVLTSAALIGIAILTGAGQPPILAITSGGCAGIMLALLACAALRIKRR